MVKLRKWYHSVGVLKIIRVSKEELKVEDADLYYDAVSCFISWIYLAMSIRWKCAHDNVAIIIELTRKFDWQIRRRSVPSWLVPLEEPEIRVRWWWASNIVLTARPNSCRDNWHRQRWIDVSRSSLYLTQYNIDIWTLMCKLTLWKIMIMQAHWKWFTKWPFLC